MATYYRWRQSNVQYSSISEGRLSASTKIPVVYFEGGIGFVFYDKFDEPYVTGNGTYDFSGSSYAQPSGTSQIGPCYLATTRNPTTCYRVESTQFRLTYWKGSPDTFSMDNGSATIYTIRPSQGSFVGYVYSTNASAYPDGGVSGSYYYGQRTTITSPTEPTNLRYNPNPITTPTVTVSWDAATSNVLGVSVSKYVFWGFLNGDSVSAINKEVVGTSTEISIPTIYNGNPVTSIQIRLYAVDTNGNTSTSITSELIPVYLVPTLTVPSLAMQGQNITVNWTAITGATSYTLQRKANTDTDWVQVYSGDALTFTETVGTWTTVQYQVQAVFSSGAGGWATSANIPVVSASALVIYGQDGDLGTLTKDVPYTVSSDTGNPITLTCTVNGVLVASLTVQNGFAYNIPVMDLPTGTGTIVISATVQATSGPVTATRTWTYTKTAFSFTNTGSTAQLQQEGKNVFPATLAECVRVGANLGGNLGLALQALANSAQYDPETGGFTDPAGNTIPVPKIETGSYTGTGTSGSANPTSITFSFQPKLFLVSTSVGLRFGYANGEVDIADSFVWQTGVTQIRINSGSFNDYTQISLSENTLSWYSNNASVGSSMQCNAVNNIYYYVAIG